MRFTFIKIATKSGGIPMRSNAVRLSRFLYWVFMSGMVVIPVFTVAYFWNLDVMLEHWQTVSPMPDVIESILPLQAPVTATTKLLTFLVAAAPATLTCIMLRRLALLFDGYANSNVFTVQSVRHLRQIGILLLVREALSPLVCAGMALALTINNPPGHHYVAVGLSSSNLTSIVTGLSLIVAAVVMERARLLHEESVLTI